MRADAMEQEIRSILAAKAARDPAGIGRHEDFQEDLGLDSLDRLDLLAEVEDELGLRLAEDRLSDLHTLDDVLRAVDAGSGKRAA